MIKGVIFDMDGVLVDSEEYICKAAIRFFAENGVTAQAEDFLPFVGAGEDRYLGGPAEKYGLELDIKKAKKRTYDIYAGIVRGKLAPLAGVREFIGRCRAGELKLAVATSADEYKMNINLTEIGIDRETFDALINGDDVEKKKPHPEIFLTAADKLGLDPSVCLVVEDAVNGVAAARAAGSKCLGLTTSFSSEELAGADWTAPTLAQAAQEVLEW